MTAGEVVIDGTHGEGGGQIVRTSLALAMITGRAVRLTGIRGKRKKPGLRPQHLTAVEASASVCSAGTTGARLDSSELSFRPGVVRPGAYRFRIGTAGAATLVLQTLLPALARAGGASEVVVGGGTHVPWSPPFHYVAEVFLPTLARLGVRAEATIRRWGWFPRGGGEIRASIRGAVSGVVGDLARPFRLERLTAVSASSRLPEHVRRRQKNRLEARLQAAGLKAQVSLMDVPALDAGSLVFICARGKESVAGFSSLGARGKPAEQVADQAADELFSFLDSGAALDPYLADQILAYFAIVPGSQRMTTAAATRHLHTNAWVIEQFLPVRFEIEGAPHQPALVVKRDR
jgi:RNA 3'-terminal phosphate cyclase (ATP)